MLRSIRCFIIVPLVCFPFWKASAVEPLTTSELAEHCAASSGDWEGADGQYCIRYIQGFIDGAVATDERVVQNMHSEYEKDESFVERAMRTRLTNDKRRELAARYAEFCLGEPVALREVVEMIINDLIVENLYRDVELARDVVYASLREHYPCSETIPD